MTFHLSTLPAGQNKFLRIALGSFLAAAAACTLAASAQSIIQTPGCTLAKRAYTCDKASFLPVLRAARTVALEVSPRDRMTRSQLRELVAALGKTLQPAGATADLTLAVTPVDSGGVAIGPGDQDLANLLIYEHTTDGERGPLVWAETFRGQADMPWPSVVHALIGQFQQHFKQP